VKDQTSSSPCAQANAPGGGAVPGQRRGHQLDYNGKNRPTAGIYDINVLGVWLVKTLPHQFAQKSTPGHPTA
jgi:hypothetical protein